LSLVVIQENIVNVYFSGENNRRLRPKQERRLYEEDVREDEGRCEAGRHIFVEKIKALALIRR